MATSGGVPPSSTPWLLESPQVHASSDVNHGSDEYGVSERPMRLKVLYTFDDQNKTNCLARWPHVLTIKTIAMDEATSIGVIELRTCIQAIVECSPELVARLGQDYTVYAYDYSEYDNPLVGQGLLSWALMAAAPTPDDPAQQSQKLITGRVCKNILGLFSNGVKETLEVKLRLVPVPNVYQSEYLSNVEKYREVSRATPSGLDFNEWTAFMQSTSNAAQQANSGTGLANSNHAQRNGTNMEVFNQLLSPTLQQPSMNPLPTTIDTSILGKEQEGCGSTTVVVKPGSRPSSRSSVKRPRAKPRAKMNAGNSCGNTSGYEDGTDGDEGPAPKKRAKITQTDWNNKSTAFGTAPESLRVAASTAGSLRLFRPIAMSPAPNVGNHLQEIPRVPTPLPSRSDQQVSRQRTFSQNSLRRPSFANQYEAPHKHISPYPPIDGNADFVRFSIESAGPSPERNSPSDSPHDIASSPPVMATVSPMHSSPPCPSSPDLPQMPRTDSGFMSGSLEELFGIDEDDLRPGVDEKFDAQVDYTKRRAQLPAPPSKMAELVIQEVTPGPVELLPTRMPDFTTQAKAAAKVDRSRVEKSSISADESRPFRRKGTGRAKPRTMNDIHSDDQATLPPVHGSCREALTAPPANRNLSDKASHTSSLEARDSQPPNVRSVTAEPIARPVTEQPRPISRGLQRTASMGALNLPTVAASDPIVPASKLRRSETWFEVPHSIMEAPAPTLSSGDCIAPRPFDIKKAAIRQKLEQAIANGETPPFCFNCGAIETPTWRKAWSQEIRGAPAYYEYSDDPGRVTTINILERDNDGKPTAHQIIKKFLSPEESQEDFKEYILCNPCGIWMSKHKTQRPEERWEINRPPKSGPDKKAPERKRTAQRRVKKSQSMNPAELRTEFNFPQSEAYLSPYKALGQVGGISPSETTQPLDLPQPSADPPQQRRRSTSAHPTKRLNAMTSNAASAALRRAIQSSPARWAGTQHSPIAIEEDDLGSTRRLLFPSPRKDGSPKVLGVMTVNVPQCAPHLSSLKHRAPGPPEKENCPPPFTRDECDTDFMVLFGEEVVRPKTPTHNSTEATPFKTPTRPTPNHRPVTRSVSKSMLSGRSTGKTLGVSQRTPSRTPCSVAVRRSPRNHSTVFESPFTATLNQLMSEANEHSTTYQQIELDFSTLPNLPNHEIVAHHSNNTDMNFLLEDFFSTDVPMPSSPPRMFQPYEDPLTLGNVDWNAFSEFNNEVTDNDSHHGENSKDGSGVKIKAEPVASPEGNEDEGDGDEGDEDEGDEDTVNLVDSSNLD